MSVDRTEWTVGQQVKLARSGQEVVMVAGSARAHVGESGDHASTRAIKYV